MKKLFFTIAVMLLGFAATAQNSGDNNGNNGGSDPDMIIVSDWRTNGNDLTQAGSDPFIGSTSAHPLRLKSNDTLRMFIDTTGYVGIGTDEPFQKFHVVGGNIMISKTADRAPGSTNGSLFFGGEVTTDNLFGNYGIEYVNNPTEGYGLNFWQPYTSTNTTRNNILFLSDSLGFVGIGTNHPKAKLSVDGMVLAKSIKVSTDAVYWPDFVFSPEHKRMSLGDLETYITANHHLPGVPSAAEVKEQEGVILEEMNAILLQKVEELTLYVIELQKRIEVLEHKE